MSVENKRKGRIVKYKGDGPFLFCKGSKGMRSPCDALQRCWGIINKLYKTLTNNGKRQKFLIIHHLLAQGKVRVFCHNRAVPAYIETI